MEETRDKEEEDDERDREEEEADDSSDENGARHDLEETSRSRHFSS